MLKINVWYAEPFAYLLKKLDSIPEGDGTVLDNTLVLWGNELGKGNSHTRREVPFVLAGKAGGILRTGRYVQFAPGTWHNDLLVACLNAMACRRTPSATRNTARVR